MPYAVYNLAILLIGLTIGGVISAAIISKVLPAWWRRQDRLAAKRRMRSRAR